MLERTKNLEFEALTKELLCLVSHNCSRPYKDTLHKSAESLSSSDKTSWQIRMFHNLQDSTALLVSFVEGDVLVAIDKDSSPSILDMQIDAFDEANFELPEKVISVVDIRRVTRINFFNVDSSIVRRTLNDLLPRENLLCHIVLVDNKLQADIINIFIRAVQQTFVQKCIRFFLSVRDFLKSRKNRFENKLHPAIKDIESELEIKTIHKLIVVTSVEEVFAAIKLIQNNPQSENYDERF